MNTLDTLRAARALIADPRDWCQNYHPTRSCSILALCRTSATSGFCMEAVRAVDSLCGDSNLVSFNDTHTHAEVLALFDKAITAEEAKAAPADVPLYVPSAWLPVEVPA